MITYHNHDKHITMPELNTLAADVFNARLAQANLIAKTIFDAKLSSHNRKITSNKTKHLLKMNLKCLKHSFQFILEEKVTLKMMAHKMI